MSEVDLLITGWFAGLITAAVYGYITTAVMLRYWWKEEE